MSDIQPSPPLPTLTPGFTLGISLDGVLRDYAPTFQLAYADRFAEVTTLDKESKSEGEQTLTLRQLRVDAASQARPDDAFDIELPMTQALLGSEEMVKLRTSVPVAPDAGRVVPQLSELTPFNVLDKFSFTSQAEVDEFVQGDGFFIFGRAPQVEGGLITTLTRLYRGVEAQGGRLVILASDMPKLRPAALFFLANLGGFYDEVRFVAGDQYWTGIDVLVTANEKRAEQIPEGKRLVLRPTQLNEAGFIPTDPTLGLTQPLIRVASLSELVTYFPSELSPEPEPVVRQLAAPIPESVAKMAQAA